MNKFLEILRAGQSLTEEQMIEAMTLIMDGRPSNEEKAEFLTLLAQRGETIEEITGAAKALRKQSLQIKAPYGAVDCCGTGGDKTGTYNISTAVAIVAAACGVPVAKHGNRSSSSKSGAADVLETIGVNLEMNPKQLEEALRRFHFAFLMGPRHHQAMRHVSVVRKQLGTRTIFNLLGPLANPAGTRLQLLGVYDRKLVVPMAQVLKNLGAKRAWVVHGTDGLDEITLTGPTYVAVLDDEKNIIEKELNPVDFGLPVYAPEKLLGGTPKDNAGALRILLDGQKGAYRDIVLANTSAVLNIHGKVKNLKDGVAMAAQAIDSHLARQTLKDYIIFSREAIPK
jgi:anthranilate phosphoribosyltransferase